MAGIPLSEETKRRVDILFDPGDAAVAAEILINECGCNLPFCENHGPLELERLRFAALKLSGGRLDHLRQAVRLAKQDWQDLLMAADFATNVQAHKSWMPQKVKP